LGIGEDLVDVLISPAGDRGGLSYAARIKADDVVAGPELLGQGSGQGLQRLDAARAGAARIEE